MNNCTRKDAANLMFKADRPHFFKIILQDTISIKKLGIPRKFATSYGKYLSRKVILKVPSGAEWEVELVKTDDEIWLRNGWPEFADYYFLSHGSFLVFEFDKQNWYFNVIIFDKSASEIDYLFNAIGYHDEEPKLVEEFHEPLINQETESDDVSVEILGSSSPPRKMKEKSPLPFSRPHKKIKSENCTGQSEGNTKNLMHKKSSSSSKSVKIKDIMYTTRL